MVPLDPPAPADRVLVGRAFLTDSLWSAAARRRSAVRGPPGGLSGRASEDAVEPAPAGDLASESDVGALPGEEGRGADCWWLERLVSGTVEGRKEETMASVSKGDGSPGFVP